MAKTKFTLTGSVESQGTVTCAIGDKLTFKAKGKRPKSEKDLFAFDVALEAMRQAVYHKDRSPNLLIEHTIAGPGEVPVLYMMREDAKNLPIVIFVHGMSGSKILSIREGVQLAQAGFFSVLIDARMHGERAVADFEEKVRTDPGKNFLEVTRGTVKDISGLIDLLATERRADVTRVGIGGISMGGYITFLAATTEKRLSVAAPIIGSPDFLAFDSREEIAPLGEKMRKRFEKIDPVTNYRRFRDVALLMQNGAIDKIVPPSGARKLDKRLTTPGNEPRAYRYIEYPDIAHDVTAQMIDRTVAWFKKHL